MLHLMSCSVRQRMCVFRIHSLFRLRGPDVRCAFCFLWCMQITRSRSCLALCRSCSSFSIPCCSLPCRNRHKEPIPSKCARPDEQDTQKDRKHETEAKERERKVRNRDPCDWDLRVTTNLLLRHDYCVCGNPHSINPETDEAHRDDFWSSPLHISLVGNHKMQRIATSYCSALSPMMACKHAPTHARTLG